MENYNPSICSLFVDGTYNRYHEDSPEIHDRRSSERFDGQYRALT